MNRSTLDFQIDVIDCDKTLEFLRKAAGFENNVGRTHREGEYL